MWYIFTLALYAVIKTGNGSKVLTWKKIFKRYWMEKGVAD